MAILHSAIKNDKIALFVEDRQLNKKEGGRKMIIPYNPRRIIADFRDMDDEEKCNFKIGCGSIDEDMIFMALYNHHPSSREHDAFHKAIELSNQRLTRCQHDLLTAEFGTEIALITKVIMSTDALLNDPLSANIAKLRDALTIIDGVAKQSLQSAQKADAHDAYVKKLMQTNPQNT